MKLTTLLRRLRGTASLAATWAVSWGIAAGALGYVGMAVVDRLYDVPIGLGAMAQAFALAGALAGAVSGVGFAMIVAATGRRQTLDRFSPLRLGLWSALPACAIGAAIFGLDPFFLSATALFSIAASVATVKVARHGEEPALTLPALEAPEPAALPGNA